MKVFAIDPLRDPRWGEFPQRHPRGSVFHTSGWLRALFRTYGYEPVALTTSPPGADLENGLVLSRVESWLTGRRLISLPFSDHCEPLVDRSDDLESLLSFLGESAKRQGWQYLEFRPLQSGALSHDRTVNLGRSETYVFHRLDLHPSEEEIFRGFHKSCIQRKVRRAEREGLAHEEGRSEAILGKFYHLLQLTRRRHTLPPQPIAWFRNLIDSLGEKLTVHIASKDGQPVASLLTLSFKKAVVYKYGCSDDRHHNLGGMPFLFWKAIQEAKKQGLEEFDLGRSEPDNSGLIAFKDHLGAAKSKLTYYRYPASAAGPGVNGWKLRTAQRMFAYMPDSVLTIAGKVLYKHIG